MGKIPIFKKPYEDELLYSWIHRLAKINGLSITTFSDVYLGTAHSRMGELLPDVRNEYISLCHHIFTYVSMSSLYLKTSPFYFESIWMTRGQQARYVNNVFRKADRLNTSVNTLFQSVRLCHECYKEDILKHGEPYLHISHQLSGVQTCYKHHIPLKTFVGLKGHACDYDLTYYQDTTEIGKIELLNTYTDYAEILYRENISTDIQQIKAVLFKAIKKRGYSVTDDYARLISDITSWQCNSLITYDIRYLLRVKMISGANVSAEEIIPLLMFLIPDANKLVDALATNIPLVKENKCDKCNTDYCTTTYAENAGFGCPFCEEKLSIQDRYEHYINHMDSTYKVMSHISSIDTSAILFHNTCRKIISIKPRAFIFEGTRCKCTYLVTKAIAKKAIEANKGFKLRKFTSANEPVVIYSSTCKHEFSCNYFKFIHFPGCRICKPKHMTAELYAERIDHLVGNEYTIIRGFVDQKTKVALKHEVCGLTQEYKPAHFLEGQRCKHCTKLEVAWNKGFNMLCSYRDECGNTNIPKREMFKDFSLGRWCQAQRDDYKNGKLSSMQISKLESIGFVWDPLEMEWNRRYEQYQRYIAQTGSAYISRRTDFEGEHLGAWVETQRKWYKLGKMSAERVKLLLLSNPNIFT